jgi:PST family polysaccharide transporter
MMRIISIVTLIAKILMVATIFIIVKTEDDYLLYAAISSGSFVVTGILGQYFVKTKSPVYFVFPSANEIKTTLVEGWHVFLSTAAISLYTSSNIFILGLLSNPVSVGYFGAADKLIKAVAGLFNPVSQAVYPYVNKLASKSREQALNFLSTYIRYISIFALIISISLFVFSGAIVDITLGARYNRVLPLLRCMSFLPFIISLSNVFGVQTMLTFGHKREFTQILIFSGLINIGLIITLATIFGEMGAALSVLLTETLVSVWMALTLLSNGINIFFKRTRR